MSIRAFRLAAWVLVSCAVGCGGKSRVETGGPGSDGGATAQAGAGSASAGGPSAAAGAPPISTECPVEPPKEGTACSYAGQGYCNYPTSKCSSDSFQCLRGKWLTIVLPMGAAETCLNYGGANVPNDGDSCECRGNLDCTFNECGAEGKVHAVCDNSTWHVTSEPCVATPCGPDGLRCKAGETCLLPATRGASYQCKHDPCSDQFETTNCHCAGSLCGNEECAVKDETVFCFCPTC